MARNKGCRPLANGGKSGGKEDRSQSIARCAAASSGSALIVQHSREAFDRLAAIALELGTQARREPGAKTAKIAIDALQLATAAFELAENLTDRADAEQAAEGSEVRP